MYRFTLLGAPAVARDEAPIVGMAPQQMAMLASLAMRAGKPVGVEELVDGLYGEEPPASAVNIIANYVLRLRKALGPSLITRSVGGYCLEAGPHQVDALEFVRGSGTAALEDPLAEVERLSQLLALWQGPTALAGLPGAWADRQREALHQQREQVRQRWFDLHLLLGRHAEVVPELAEACAQHPYAEHLHASHMRALARCGRQADALAVFRSLRATLADELGIDPAPEVTAVHEAILRGEDPGPAATPPVSLVPGAGAPTAQAQADIPADGARPVPRQLPPVVPDFTGRAAETVLLAATLTGGDTGDGDMGMPVATVTGMGGAGKTTLALATAHRVADGFPGGQLFADLRGADTTPADPQDVLAGFLTALGHPAGQLPDSLGERTAAFRSAVAESPVLVVLDNAADTAQVLPLLPGGSRCAALVTSRRFLTDLPAAARVAAAALPPAEAAALVGRIVGEARAAAEPDAVDALIETCARHPLALRIAASRLAARPHWSVASLADRLHGPSGAQVGELVAGDLRIEACFQLGYYQLTPDQARAFRLLAVLDAVTLPADFAAAVLDCPPAEAEELCEQLVDVALLESPAPGTYRFHDLVRAYARTLPPAGPGEADAAVARMVAACAGTLAAAHPLLFPADPLPAALPGVPVAAAVRSFASESEVIARFEEETELLLASLAQATRLGESGTFATAAQASLLFVDFAIYGITPEHLYTHLGQLLDVLLASPRAADADALSLAAVHLAAGELCMEQVLLEEAERHLRHADELAVGHDLFMFRIREKTANAAFYRGDHRKAVDLIAQAVPLAEKAGDLTFAGAVLAISALSRVELDELDGALADANRALETARVREDEDLLVSCHVALGMVHRRSGRPLAALDHYAEALRVLRASGKILREQAQAQYGMAFALLDSGDAVAALDSAEQALDLVRPLGTDAVPYGRVQEVMGRAHLVLGNHRQAAEHLRRAIAVYGPKGLSEAAELAPLLSTAQTA